MRLKPVLFVPVMAVVVVKTTKFMIGVPYAMGLAPCWWLKLPKSVPIVPEMEEGFAGMGMSMTVVRYVWGQVGRTFSKKKNRINIPREYITLLRGKYANAADQDIFWGFRNTGHVFINGGHVYLSCPKSID